MGANSKYYPIENLRNIRKEKFRSRKSIAKKAIISEKTIERAERGEDRLELDSIEAIASALGLSADEIIDKKRSEEKNKLDLLKMRINDNISPHHKLSRENCSNINQLVKNIKVRYRGSGGAIYFEDGDKLKALFFTSDREKSFNGSKIDISIDIEENVYLKIMDKLYHKYKDKLLDLQGLDESYFNNEAIKILNQRINLLRLIEDLTLRIIEDEII